MNILVIGNGFDLAHGLSTKYADFLQYIKNNDFSEIDSPEAVEEIKSLVSDNVFIQYFNEKIDFNKGWIDFESEISLIISSLDFMKDYFWSSKTIRLSLVDELRRQESIAHKILGLLKTYVNTQNLTSEEYNHLVIEPLAKHLSKLVRALEIYLCKIIEKKNIDIKIPEIEGLGIEKVLSFNYTHTYEKMYDNQKIIEYDYIHGQANIENSVDDNNLVLGIDEYLNEEEKNNKLQFIQFKKYFLRIHKETGCKYKSWITRSNRHAGDRLDYIYIYGHSLDVTDKDILRDLILGGNARTSIFYYNKQVYAQQITNLVKIIGQDELIKRVSEPNKTIIFIQQQDMVLIE